MLSAVGMIQRGRHSESWREGERTGCCPAGTAGRALAAPAAGAAPPPPRPPRPAHPPPPAPPPAPQSGETFFLVSHCPRRVVLTIFAASADHRPPPARSPARQCSGFSAGCCPWHLESPCGTAGAPTMALPYPISFCIRPASTACTLQAFERPCGLCEGYDIITLDHAHGCLEKGPPAACRRAPSSCFVQGTTSPGGMPAEQPALGQGLTKACLQTSLHQDSTVTCEAAPAGARRRSKGCEQRRQH